MPAGNTYEALATVTLASAATTQVVMSSIPGTYTDLVLVVSNITNASSTNSIFLRFNSDSGTNYSSTFLEGNGTSATSNRVSNRTVIDSGYNVGLSTTNPGQITFNIMNYANTTTFKTVLSRFAQASGAAPGTSATVSLWRATPAAITSIEARCDVNMGIGTTFSLYGVKNA
jgi:hypothetical protein